MAAVAAGHNEVAAALGDARDVWIANLNGPRQTVIAGTRAGVERCASGSRRQDSGRDR